MNEKPTILIVDDDYAGREAIRGVLFSQGYCVLEADNGQKAIEMAQNHIPDLILLDLMMPGMDGFEVCQRLRRDPILCEVPILMVTALDDRESRLRGIDAGADDFVSKPYDRMELRLRVRTIVRLSRYRHLLLERARFVWVIENDQDSYFILDEHGKINFANKAARILLNLPNEEAEFSNWSFWERIQTSFLCVPPERWETWPEIEDLEESLYLIRPQNERNRPLWFEVQVLDLPWLNKQQRLLRIKEVTQSFSQAFETWSFQAAARHKLVTPLSNMLLSLNLMRAFANQQGFSKDVYDCLETLDEGTKRLESEIKDVFKYIYTPGLANTGDLAQLSDISGMVQQTARDLNLVHVNCSITDHWSRDPTLPLTKWALQIILWELLENAQKFHPQLDPKVNIRLLCHNSDEVIVEVADDGTYVPLEHLKDVFTPYYQAEKTYTGEINGMGLGLSTVAALIWQVGGTISLQNSQESPGVIVEMRFPLSLSTSG